VLRHIIVIKGSEVRFGEGLRVIEECLGGDRGLVRAGGEGSLGRWQMIMALVLRRTLESRIQ